MIKTKSTSSVYYPVFFNIQGKKCVVIGGGKVALRKIKTLLDSKAKVIVISTNPDPEIIKWFKKKVVHLIRRGYEAGDLKNAVMAIAATDVKAINRKVAADSKKAGVFVNVVDDPEQSDFIIPSFFRRGHLTIAVSTGGRSPAFSRKIRTELEKNIGKEYASLTSLIAEVRSSLRKKGIRLDRETWQEAIDLEPLIQFIRAGKRNEAKAFLFKRLAGRQNRNPDE